MKTVQFVSFFVEFDALLFFWLKPLNKKRRQISSKRRFCYRSWKLPLYSSSGVSPKNISISITGNFKGVFNHDFLSFV